MLKVKGTGCPPKKFTLGNQHSFGTIGHSEDYIYSDQGPCIRTLHFR